MFVTCDMFVNQREPFPSFYCIFKCNWCVAVWCLVIFKNLDNPRTSVIMKKCCLCGSELETCLVVLPYVCIFQSCLGAKQPKQILPLRLFLDFRAMLLGLWSQLVTNSVQQNPYGEASQIPCFFMEPKCS
jgi:hypothetical protein